MRDYKSKAIAILGMHRSGTSVITRAINLLGAYLGEEKDMMPTMEDNPSGFWERYDVVVIHNRILIHFKRPWDTPLSLPRGWHLTEDAGPFKVELRSLVKKNFSGKKLWIWKDPRTCLTFDLWRDVLDELGVETASLFVVRNPLDVASSLEKRNGFSRDKSLGIWFNYTLAALKATSGVPRVFISYDRFLEDWETELRRCASALGVAWPGDDSELKGEMKNFVRPEFRHSASTMEDLKKEDTPPPVTELYELMEGVLDSTAAPEGAFASGIDRLFEDFSSYSTFFREDMERPMVEAKKRLAAVEKKIDAIHNSWSWKVTAPFRAVTDFMVRSKRLK